MNEFDTVIAPSLPSSTGSIPVASITTKTKKITRSPQDLKVVDFVRVYVLGDGSDGRVIEEYAGQTGYHIRTIPKTRFRNPVALAAGAGYLAVVDRFGGSDLIRVTDKYAGGGASSFDTNGFPKNGVNWGSIADVDQIPIAGRVTGLQILPRGILIGAVDTGTGVPLFFKRDLDGGYDLYTGTFKLPAPFDTLGTPMGRISTVDQTQTDWVHEVLVIIKTPTGANCLAKIDFLEEKLTGLIGLPDGTPYGVSNAGGIISVQMGDTNGITSIFRLERLDNSYWMSGVYSDLLVPSPDSNTGVTSTFTPLDIPNESSTNYYYLAQTLNNRFGPPLSINEETTADPAVSQGGRTLTGTTGSHNDNREAKQTRYTTNFYERPYDVPAQQIVNSALILDSDVYDTTIAEMVLTKSDGAMDSSKPVFRLVHGTHYDYLSDGGFTYGCKAPGQDESTPVTSGIQPVSIAIDKSSEPGKLKELPDLKVALIDTKTGLLLYTGTKSLGFNWYGGTSAGLKLTSDTLTTLKKTACTDVHDTALDATYDGVAYTYGPDGSPTSITRDHLHLDQFATANDGRSPWTLFIPRVLNSGKISVQPADNRSIQTRNGDGAYLDWWLPSDAHKPPAITLNATNQLFYPPRGSLPDPPTFQTSCSSGFFGLNWQKQENRTVDQSNNVKVTYTTPDSILNYKVAGLETTPAEEAGTPETVIALPAALKRPMLEAESGLGEHGDLTRGVVFDTNIRSWVGIEVFLQREGFFNDGVDGWIQPSAFENGLGVRVGKSAAGDAGHVSSIHCGGPRAAGIMPAYGYDYGDYAYNGANGAWQIEIFANGVPISTIGHLVTFDEQIEFQAPGDAQEALLSTLHASTPSLLGYHKGKVYYSSEVITEVTVRAKLINYAYEVYRIGFHTLAYDQDDYIGDGPILCPGADPGFYAGNNCEAICCGNVSCASQVLFGGKLYADDPIRARVINTLWEGQATFSIPAANNPYAAKGVSVGTVINGYLEFSLNAPMNAYNINLRTGDSG